MSRPRKYSNSGFNHIYQITCDRGIIFCTMADCIFMYTLICTRARKYEARVVAITIMLNHFHIEIKFKKESDMTLYMKDITSVYAKKYNVKYGLSGKVFHKPFGNSPKPTESLCYNNYFYVLNNGREKKAVEKTEEYRWNFLKYMACPNPWSEPFRKQEASPGYWSLIDTVTMAERRNKALDYQFFDSEQFVGLDNKEKFQMIDFIINTYNVIDNDFALSRYHSYDKICEAVTLIPGDESKKNDDNDKEDYRHYYSMIKIAKEEGYDVSKKRYVGVGHEKRNISPEFYHRLLRRFRREVNTNNKEIIKFFHLPKGTIIR